MRHYTINAEYDDLEPWPFEREASNYRIIRGNPQASGRLDLGVSDGQHRMGVWRCSEGTFRCTELGDELQTIIRGRLILTRENGETIHCSPGDSIFTRKGERLTWDIQEEVTKVFFTYDHEGDAPGWE